MKERIGRVGEVKEMSDLRNPYPGGKDIKPHKPQTWLEEENEEHSSNHPVQDPDEPLSSLKVGLRSSTLLGSMLLRMAVSRGDEEHSSSA